MKVLVATSTTPRMTLRAICVAAYLSRWFVKTQSAEVCANTRTSAAPRFPARMILTIFMSSETINAVSFLLLFAERPFDPISPLRMRGRFCDYARGECLRYARPEDIVEEQLKPDQHFLTWDSLERH